MKRLFAIIGTVPLVLAACGDDDDNSADTVASATTEATTEATSGASSSSAAVTVVDVEGMGSVLADPKGMVLYFNDQDTSSAVLCVDACTDEWPPLAASGTPSAEGVTGLSTTDRPDGTKQVTYNGHPLYTFVDDDAPMKATGDGDSDEFGGQKFTWHAATVSAPAGGSGATTAPGGTQAASTPSTTGY